MDFRYILVYSLVNVFCIATILIIISKLGYNIGSDMEVRMFRRMSISFVAFLLFELVWALSMGRAIQISLQAGGIIKVIDTMFIPVMVFAIVFGLSMDYEVFLVSRIRIRIDPKKHSPERILKGVNRHD